MGRKDKKIQVIFQNTCIPVLTCIRNEEITLLYTHLAALAALGRKKRLEKQLQQIDGTLSTVEFQREALEGAHTNTEVLKNMGYAAKALKAAHSHL